MAVDDIRHDATSRDERTCNPRRRAGPGNALIDD